MGISVGGYWAARLAWADRLERAGSVRALERAIQISPQDAEYWLAWAEHLQEQGRDPLPALERAAAVNPRNAAIWMELGLRREMRGDLPGAERDLLKAARLSRRFQPRWTLAHYYFRRARPEAFWRWTREALAISYGDVGPLFRLCWETSSDDALILDRAIPDRPPVWTQYLEFLLSEHRPQAAYPVARRLLAQAGAGDVSILVACSSHLLRAGLTGPAVEIWNGLCSRRLIPYTPIDPARGRSLTNGDFSASPLGEGFDWRVVASPGISSARLPAGWRLTFSGQQPEKTETLVQYLPLICGREYYLRFDYQTAGIAAPSGIHWQLADAASGAELPAHSPQLSSSVWKSEAVAFTTPAASELVILALSYRRPSGSVRAEGTLSLRAVSLELAP